jgi:hypothetical protein
MLARVRGIEDVTRMEPQEFNRQLVVLQKIIAEGIAYFSAWRGLRVGDADSAQALNRYKGLFLPAQIALQSQTLMQFAKVFDKHPKAISLRNLLTAAKENRLNLTPQATEKELQDIEEKINNSESLLIRLKRYRDTRLAHHDAIVAVDTSLLYGEVNKLVEDVKSMYNSLTKGQGQWVTSFEQLARDAERHTSEVVRIMREERDRAMQRVKEIDNATLDSSQTL